MTPAVSRQIGLALLLALPLAAGLFVFAESCGSIHGSPRCGALSFPAVVLVVLPLMLGSAVLRSPPSQAAVRILMFVVAYAFAFVACLLVLWWRSRRRASSSAPPLRRPRTGDGPHH